jgi:hypothetical protein
MALEKWLYDEVDAGHDIGGRCQRLLRESGSVAIVGVLVSVGCRHPDLLTGPLLPILSSAEILLWQARWRLMTHTALRLALMPEREWMRRLMQDWHELDHRKASLEELALNVMLFENSEPFERFRQLWLAQVGQDGEPAALRFLAARFHHGHWQQRTHQSGTRYLEFIPPEDLQQESEGVQAELAEGQFWLTWPMRMRRVLDGEDELPEEQIEAVWQQVRPLLEQGPPDDITRDGVLARDNAACGFAAVLVLRHRAWLGAHRELDEWCVETLLAAIEAERQRHIMDSEVGGTDWSWDAFCAAALPVLWAERPADERLRRAVARLAQHLHYAAIRALSTGCHGVLGALGSDFRRLLHLAVSIAVARSHEYERSPADRLARARATEALAGDVEAFVSGMLIPEAPRWATIAVPNIERRDRLNRGLDVGYVYAAHAWIPSLLEARDEDELDHWLTFFTEAVDAVVRRLRRDRDARHDEADGTPYSRDTELLWALPERIMQVTLDRGRVLWEPLLALGSYAHHWVESFLSAWAHTGLAADPVPTGFADRWRAMIEFAATAERWHGESHDERESDGTCWASASA